MGLRLISRMFGLSLDIPFLLCVGVAAFCVAACVPKARFWRGRAEPVDSVSGCIYRNMQLCKEMHLSARFGIFLEVVSERHKGGGGYAAN